MNRVPPRSERGLALLSVLILVAVLAVLATAVLDVTRFGIRRAANARETSQARWYAIGAETLARAELRRLHLRDQHRTTLRGGWHGRPIAYPVEGGLISATLTDAGNCFNLNSLGAASGDQQTAVPLAERQLRDLMRALGLPEAQAVALVAAAGDWIDSDRDGIEDAAYARLAPSYLPANQQFAEVSELRAVQGVTPALYQRLRPYLCALPDSVTRLNVNTLQPAMAPLVTMLTGGQVSAETVRSVLARRPPGGWDSPEAFWAEPAFRGVVVADPTQAGIATRWFALAVDARYGRAETTMSALLEQTGTGAVRLVARRWTRAE